MMTAMAMIRPDLDRQATANHWLGRSGAVYALEPEPLASFVLDPGRLYLLAGGGQVLWVGELASLVGDAAHRTGFRTALAAADAAFSIAAPADEIALMTLAWDLEAATPAGRIAGR